MWSEQDYASWSQVCDIPEGSGPLFADIIRRLQSRYFSPPQKTKLKGTGLNDNKGEFTLTIEEKTVMYNRISMLWRRIWWRLWDTLSRDLQALTGLGPYRAGQGRRTSCRG